MSFIYTDCISKTLMSTFAIYRVDHDKENKDETKVEWYKLIEVGK